MSDLIGGLIGVAVGWGLSQGTEVVKSCLRDKKLKRLLTQELKDIELVLSERVATFKDNVDDYPAIPIISYGAPIHTPFLEHHYVEVANQLSDSQRYNLRILRDSIANINSGIEWIILNCSTQSSLPPQEIRLKLISIYRVSRHAQAILTEANKMGGQERINELHPTRVKIAEEIPKY